MAREGLYETAVVHREIDQLANAIKSLQTDPNGRRIIVTAWNPALTWKAALPPCHLYFQFISHELTLEQRAAMLADRVELDCYDLNKEALRMGQSYPCQIEGEHFNLDVARLSTADDEAIHQQLDGFGIKRRGLYCFLLLRSNDLGLGQPFNVAQYASLTHMVAQCVDMAPLELVWAAVDAHVYTNHVEALQHQLTLDSKDCIPRIKLRAGITDIDAFTINDVEIVDYEAHAPLSDRMPVAV
ncbi:Thymidylate synthase [compost metagenome]